ncbi:MAG: IclR family transcriptional regulator [Bacillota bacterium]
MADRSEAGGLSRRNTVQAVERALDILSVLAETGGDGISVSELAGKVDLKLSTTHRLLQTMMKKLFVDKDPRTGFYKIGSRTMGLGNSAMRSLDLRSVARPLLEELTSKTGETTNLAILDRGEVVYIDQIESTNMIIVKMFAKPGSRGPAYCTGSGKVLLAYLPSDEQKEIIKNIKFVKFTPETIDSPDHLYKELSRVCEEGYALDLGERDEGVRCVAAPVRSYDGKVEAAVSLSGPAMRLTNYYMNHELIGLVKDTAEKISGLLGYHPAGV